MTPRKPRPAAVPPEPEPPAPPPDAAVAVVAMTPDVVAEDGRNRIARTGVQAGSSVGLVIVGNWFAHELGWHGEMPNEVALALAGLLTTAGSWLSNLKRLRGVV